MLTLYGHHLEYWYVVEYRFEFSDTLVEFAYNLVEVADYEATVLNWVFLNAEMYNRLLFRRLGLRLGLIF